MSRIDELIAELCPDGVRVALLGAVASVSTGSRPASEDLDPLGAFPLINGGVKHSGAVSVPNTAGDAVTIPSRGSVGIVGYQRDAFWCGPLSYRIASKTSTLDTRFLFFALKSRQPYIVALQQSGSIPALNKKELVQVPVPVPPIEIQHEIVRMLDVFTQLEAELEAELEARRLQFAHVRRLSLIGGEFRSLGDFATFKYGHTAAACDEGEYRFLRITDIDPWGKLRRSGAKFVARDTTADEYLVHPGDLLMARTGATFGKTLLAEQGQPSVYASFLIRIRLDDKVMLPAFYWHFAQSDIYWGQANAMVSTGGQPQFNANVLAKIRVPVPPLAEQARAVATLDKLDALVNDLSVGLPAELQARRRQYEHYRDRRLTFKEFAA